MHKLNFICKEFYIGIAGVIVQLCHDSHCYAEAEAVFPVYA